LLKALGRDSGLRNIKEISPYRFSAPLSPNIAANLENKNVNFEELIKFCQNAINKSKNNNHHLFIEGAGGVMTPITHNKSFADLISALEISTILVVGNYLGSISHTLTAIKAMQSYNIKIDKIILNCRDDLTYLDDHIKTLKNFTDVKIVLEF
jgi:dethiobiotin synthetase